MKVFAGFRGYVVKGVFVFLRWGIEKILHTDGNDLAEVVVG